MIRPLLVPCVLLMSSCYNQPGAGGSGSLGDSSGGTASSTSAETTASSADDATATSTTMTSTTMTSTTMTSTTMTSTTDETSVATQTDESGSGSDSTTVTEDPGCLDGLFAGDAPPFGAAEQIATLYNTQGVEIVDVDDDGDNDLLLGDFGDQGANQPGVYFMAGSGDGTFSAPVKLPGGDAPTIRIAAAAIADDTIDVVGLVALPPNFSIIVRRWRGNGDGTFLAPTDYPAASDWDVFLADVNGDGRRDLLGTNSAGARVSVASAAETFGVPSDFGGMPTVNAIKSADLDGDGDGDIVSGTTDQLGVLLGNGDGTFADIVIYPFEGSIADILIADFDGDGALDVGATWDAIVGVWPGDGSGAFGEISELTVQGSTLAAATPDFDGDGCADIAVFNNSGSVSTIMGRDEFTFTTQEVFNIVPVGYAYDLAAGDVDGDQIADIVGVTADGSPDTGGEIFLLRSAG